MRKTSLSRFDVLVTDANQRVALEVTRSLGKKGLNVSLVETSDIVRPLTFASTYGSHFRLIEDYAHPSFKSLVEDVDVVFPISTNTHYSLYQLPDRLLTKILLPSERTFRSVNHKETTRKQAKALGIPVPKTRIIGSSQEPDTIPNGLEEPVVLKLENDEDLYLPPDQRYRIVVDDQDFRESFKELSRHEKPIMIQEYIPGDGYGFSGIWDTNSQLIAGGAHHRLREWPPEGGPSTYCETVDEPELRVYAEKLMKTVGWSGPAMVEFRRHREKDTFYLLEVNPRYWGSLPLLRAAGLNVPYLHYCHMTGKQVSAEELTPEAGITLSFTPIDLVAIYREWQQGKGTAGQLVRALLDQFDPSVRRGLFEWSDPYPFGRYLINRLGQTEQLPQ